MAISTPVKPCEDVLPHKFLYFALCRHQFGVNFSSNLISLDK